MHELDSLDVLHHTLSAMSSSTTLNYFRSVIGKRLMRVVGYIDPSEYQRKDFNRLANNRPSSKIQLAQRQVYEYQEEDMSFGLGYGFALITSKRLFHWWVFYETFHRSIIKNNSLIND